mmetsp:Transcript_37000/g.110801  ORF Transcript_37000/g.110801 Transcript_37000/m.110801 type:complete len:221 (-) Transcript_37000:126-788(-)
MRRPIVVQSCGVDQWPLFLLSSSGKCANSLVAGLWQSLFPLLSSSLAQGRGGQHTLESLFDAAVNSYHEENMYDLLNECKERAFSEPVWRLDFQVNGTDFDPWHIDLCDCLLGEDGKPNIGALQQLQQSYTSGEAFLRGSPSLVLVWARNHRNYQRWRKIAHSKPYCCPITGWQGDSANLPIDLVNEVLKAFNAVARPEFVCGDKSGIQKDKIADIFGPK